MISIRISRLPHGEGLPLPGRQAPVLGADTDALLADAGYSAGDIDRLRSGGVI